MRINIFILFTSLLAYSLLHSKFMQLANYVELKLLQVTILLL